MIVSILGRMTLGLAMKWSYPNSAISHSAPRPRPIVAMTRTSKAPCLRPPASTTPWA